ncbi:LysR family transcriptional regulator [Spelaeicoccus albus]|nr:LysR family transcriptional regulator [Spelaeicoccus albus]
MVAEEAMTLTQLQAFLSTLDEGTFTAASRTLRTSQASVSELVARLEAELGTRLFVRGGRRLVATEAANELRQHARQALTAMSNGVDAVHALNALESGTCTFGVPRNAAYYGLSDLAERFHQSYPGVRVRLLGVNSALVAHSIAEGEFEAGLVVLPTDDQRLDIKPLARDEVLYASATRDPGNGPITMEEAAASVLVLYDAYTGWDDPTRKQLLNRAALRGLTLDPHLEVEHVETAMLIAASGQADTIVNSAIERSGAIPESMNTVPFAEPLYDTLALVSRKGESLSPAARRMAELAVRRVRQTGGTLDEP